MVNINKPNPTDNIDEKVTKQTGLEGVAGNADSDLLKVFSQDKNIEAPVLKAKIFEVSSEGWETKEDEKSGVTYKESPTNDIWEYVDGVPENMIGRQLFTWEAMIKEVYKAGETLRTNEEWIQIEKAYKNKEQQLIDDFGIPLAGYRNLKGSFEAIKNNAIWWAGEESSESDANRRIFIPEVGIYRPTCNKVFGLLVVCKA